MGQFWERGKLSELAEASGLSPSTISDIIHRRRPVGRVRALILEKASEQVLGYPIPVKDWLTNKTTKHPAFK